MKTLFLSASIPLPDRDERFFRTADVIAIRDAVKSLVTTALGDSTIVFGGHPAITPLVASMLRDGPKDLWRRVVLYQSGFYKRVFPEENEEFVELQIVPPVGVDEEASKAAMRQEMLDSQDFDAGIFIGGMEGVWDEYQSFVARYRSALCFPLASTGGAALEIWREYHRDRTDLLEVLAYPNLFRKMLDEMERRPRPARGLF